MVESLEQESRDALKLGAREGLVAEAKEEDEEGVREGLVAEAKEEDEEGAKEWQRCKNFASILFSILAKMCENKNFQGCGILAGFAGFWRVF